MSESEIHDELQRRYDELASFQIMSLQLRKLLHIMSAQSDDDDGDGDVNGDAKKTGVIGSSRIIPDNRILRQQIMEAKKSFDRIRNFGNYLLGTMAMGDEDDSEDIIAMLEYLDAAVSSSCQIVEEQLEARGAPLTDDSAVARYINHIFFDDLDEDDDDENDDSASAAGGDGSLRSESESISLGLSDDEGDRTNHHEHTISSPMSSKPKKLTPEEIQKQQEEMLQEEISNMASQLKQSSLHIKSTLASQNVHLDEMETLAQENLDRTKDVTDKVTDENKRRWKKGVGRWIVFFIILGSWVFCFLTIRLVPKRQGACLFFCDKDSTTSTSESSSSSSRSRKRDEEYTYTHNSRTENAGRMAQKEEEGKTSDRTVEAKLSYCRDKDGNSTITSKGIGKDKQQQCTHPQNPVDHGNMMGKYYQNDNNPTRAEDVAFVLAEENKEKRFQEKLQKAQQERDDVASSRVRDGWDVGTGTNTNTDAHGTSKDYKRKIQNHNDEDEVNDDVNNVVDDDDDDEYLNYIDDDDNDDNEYINYYGDDDDDMHDDNEEEDPDDDMYNGNEDDDDIGNGSDSNPDTMNPKNDVVDEHIDDDTTYDEWDEYYRNDEEEEGNLETEDDEDDEEEEKATAVDFDALGYDQTTLVEAVRGNDEETTAFILKHRPYWIQTKDQNGWQPIHEAVRAGSSAMVELLLKFEADINARTGRNDGGSALWWAARFHPEEHPVVKYLVSEGATFIAPGERTEL